MLKFLVGILAVQAITAVLVLVIPVDSSAPESWLKLAAPLVGVGILTAIWFSFLAGHMTKEKIARLKIDFAGEREKLKVNAERAKTRLVKQNHKEIAKESRRIRIKANMKVCLAFAGALGAGVVMLITEFMTMGLLTLTTVAGALGGYLFRARKDSETTLPVGKPDRLAVGNGKKKPDAKKILSNQK
jgi:hypothetical protein